MPDLIIVSGALANKYRNGGEACVRMSWVAGFQRLGFDVCFIEQIAPAACVDGDGQVTSFEHCVNRTYFRQTLRRFGLERHAALVYADGRGEPVCEGVAWSELLELASRATLLVNVSGHLTLEPLLARIRRKAYVDIDP